MAAWGEVVVAAPELAAAVQGRFKAHRHAILGTLRRDGSPRLSGTETDFSRGQLWLGSMGGSRKGADLRRDPRFALHSAPLELDMKEGDARITGQAQLVSDPDELAAYMGVQDDKGTEPPGPFDLFRADVTEVVLVRVADDLLVVDSWSERDGLRQVKRT